MMNVCLTLFVCIWCVYSVWFMMCVFVVCVCICMIWCMVCMCVCMHTVPFDSVILSFSLLFEVPPLCLLSLYMRSSPRSSNICEGGNKQVNNYMKHIINIDSIGIEVMKEQKG
jgi:hypothetical protein